MHRSSRHTGGWTSRIWALFLVVALTAAACGGDDDVGTSDTTVGTSDTTVGTSDTTQGDSDDAGATGEPLKIGFLVPLLGPYASIGEDLVDGFELYMDEVDGAFGGRPVELIVEDSEANPEVAVRKANKLINDDKVDIATGVVSSAVALAVRDAFDEAQVPLVISNANANAITGERKSEYVFRTSTSTFQLADPLGRWMHDEFGGEGVFVTVSDYAAGHEYRDFFKESYAEAGGSIHGEQAAPFGSTQDYQPFLSEIRSSGATSVFAFYAGSEAINFVRQYTEFGLDNIPLVGVTLTTEDIVDQQGSAAVGVKQTAAYIATLDNPTNERFVQAYAEKHDEKVPSPFIAYSYDAAQLIENAVQALDGNTEDKEAFVEALENVGPIDSPRGSFEIDPVTHNPIQHIYLSEVQENDGKLENVLIEDLGEVRAPG